MAKRLSFKRMSKLVDKVVESSGYAAEMDAGFDAGEFSGPGHARLLDIELQKLFKENGWTEDEYLDAVYGLESRRG